MKIIQLKYVPTQSQVADIFSKSLSKEIYLIIWDLPTTWYMEQLISGIVEEKLW